MTYRSTLFGSLIRSITIALMCMGLNTEVCEAQVVGDYGTVASGNWSTGAIWGQWNGAIFTGAPGVPPLAATAYVNHAVVLPLVGSPYAISNLIITSAGRLWTNDNATNIYMYVYGSTIQCDGQVGDNGPFDGISFGIEGANVIISGTGIFDASRIRKNTNSPNATSNLTIARNVDLHFTGGSTTQIYNAAPTSLFNVTINNGVTVNLIGAAGGNVSMDGITGTTGGNQGGSILVNGTLNVSGTIYLTSANTTGGYACSFTVGATGYVRSRLLNCPASTSAAAGSVLNLNAGGTIEVYGTPTPIGGPFSTGNNVYNIATGSVFYYSALGVQTVETGFTGGLGVGYGKLRVGGTGIKQTNGLLNVRSDLDIVNTLGVPILDVTVAPYNINVAGNWTSYGQAAFTERTGTVIFNGAGAQTVNTTGGEDFYNLRLSKTVAGTTLTMGSNVTLKNLVTSSLVWTTNCVLDLGGNTLIVQNQNNLAFNNASNPLRYIFSEQSSNASKVQWTINGTLGPHLIPFGKASAYMPFTFDLSLGNAGDVTVSTYATPGSNLPWPVTPTPVTNLNSVIGLSPDNRLATVDRFWQVDVTGTPTASLTFTYASTELPSAPYNTPLAMEAQRWNSGTSKWDVGTVGQSSTTYTVTAPGVSLFGPWALAPVIAPLPIELVSFTGTPVCGAVELKWSTASEKNNDHFTLMRSADGLLFDEVTRVPGAGDSQSLQTYSYRDGSAAGGAMYYVLSQTDMDGTTTDSPAIVVQTLDRHCAEVVSLFPNPASDVIHVFGSNWNSEQPITITIEDLAGRMVRSFGSVDQRMIDVNVSDLAGGQYLLTIDRAGESRSYPVSVLR